MPKKSILFAVQKKGQFFSSINFKQDQGSTALPFHIFLEAPDWFGAVEDTGLGNH